MTDMETCESAYISRKYYIQRFIEGMWLLDSPMTIAWWLLNDGIVSRSKAERLLWNSIKLREDRFHVFWNDPRIARADLPKKTS